MLATISNRHSVHSDAQNEGLALELTLVASLGRCQISFPAPLPPAPRGNGVGNNGENDMA